MSSLCDGMVVLHMPCEDNKQKVQQDTKRAVFLVCTNSAASVIPAVPPSGRHCAALQPCDRAGDQTGHDGQQDQLRQHQPWQVRLFLPAGPTE